MRVCFAYVALAPYGSPARLCRSRSIRLAFAAIATRYAAPPQRLAYVALAPYGSLSRLSLRDTPLRNKKPVGQRGE